MGKRKRRQQQRARTWFIAAGVTAAVVITGALSAAALTRHTTDLDAVAAGTDRILAERDARVAAEAAAVEAALEARRTRITPPTDRAMRVAFLGDSLSVGSYSTSRELGWTSLTTAGMGVPIASTVEATSGQTVTDALRKPIPSDQDLVFVELGTNDVSRSDPETFSVDYRAYLAEVKGRSPEARVICLTPFIPSRDAAPFTEVVEAACGEIGATVTDLAPIFENGKNRSVVGTAWYGGIVPDNGHPNDQGHRAIADKLLEFIVLS